MKKLLALLLALVMVFSMVACGSTEETPKADNEASNAPAKEDASAESAEPAEKNKSLSILWTGTGNGEMANEAVAMMEEQYGLDINLEYNTVAHEVF